MVSLHVDSLFKIKLLMKLEEVMKSICMQCRKEIAEHNNECECGCKRMIIGDNYIFTEDNVKCKCGNDKFGFAQSLNCTDHHVTVYKCSECGNCITIYTYKDEDEWFY